MKVTGVLNLSNGTGLFYPFPLVVHSLSRMCDEVIIGVDPNFPKDRETIESFGLDNTLLVDSAWDQLNRNGGTELAIQADRMVDIAHNRGADWVVAIQADEIYHDDDFPMLRAFMERNLDTWVNGFSTERIYFWKNLSTIRKDWNVDLVRIYKPKAFKFLTKGTSMDGCTAGRISPGETLSLPYKMFHYSRVDPNPLVISKRVRNLCTLYHAEEDLIPVGDLEDYDFTPRTHDDYIKAGMPTEVQGEFYTFEGTHPIGVEEWYRYHHAD